MPSFFELRDGLFHPTEHARGPWGPQTLHGRVVAALFARCFENEHGDASFHFARMTTDLFRMPTPDPIEISTERIRDGRRIRVAHAVARSKGREIARASAVQLRVGETPPGTVWAPGNWDAPAPDQLETARYEGSDWVPMWETRQIDGAFVVGAGRKRLWMRETRSLVAGELLSPFVRVASAADIASPLAMSGDEGLQYVNADITLYLHRLPKTEWVGWEVTDHGSANGVGQGECRIYDEQGPIGRSAVCAVANPRVLEP